MTAGHSYEVLFGHLSVSLQYELRVFVNKYTNITYTIQRLVQSTLARHAVVSTLLQPVEREWQ